MGELGVIPHLFQLEILGFVLFKLKEQYMDFFKSFCLPLLLCTIVVMSPILAWKTPSILKILVFLVRNQV